MRILVNLAGILKEDSQSLYAKSMLKALVTDPGSPHFFILVANGNISWPASLRSDRVEVVTINFAKGKFLSFFALQCIVPFIFFKKRASIIYSPTTLFPWLLVKKSVVTIHDLAYATFPEESGAFARSIMSLSYSIAAKFSKHIVAISKTTAEAVKKLYKREHAVIVVYNAPVLASGDVEAYTICPSIPHTYILYMGINRKRKNLAVLIEALQYVSGVYLVIAGDRLAGSHEEFLAKKHGVEKRIIELGYIAAEFCKIKLYKDAAIFAFPTLDEGFGLPVVEAQTLGTPLVVSDIAIMREVAGDGALFADPKDPKIFGDAINHLLSDGKLREELRERGFVNARRFSWVASAKVLAAIFNEIKK